MNKPGGDPGIVIELLGAVLVHRGLVGMGTVEDALAGHAGEQPHQLGGFRDVALAIEPHLLRVQATSQPAGRDLQGRTLGTVRLLVLDQAVQVGQEEEALDALGLAGGNGRADGADVVAQMRSAGGGNASEDAGAHVRSCGFLTVPV
jgi:hypothetical protein